MSYSNIVNAISETLGSQHLGAAGWPTHNDAPTAAAVTSAIVEAQQLMPDYLRMPMRVLTLLFDCTGILRGGRLFRALPLDARQAQLAAWRDSRIGLCRNFVRFYESLFLLIVLQEGGE